MPVVTDHTALLSGVYWGGLEVTGPVFLTYSFLGAAPASHADPGVMGSAVTTFQAFDGPDRALARTALAEWADASGLTLLEVAPALGSLNFAWYDFTGTVWDGAGGFAFFPFGEWSGFSYPYFSDQMPPGTAAGDIFINLDFIVGGLPDYDLLLHEIGHALGFKHPFEEFGDHDETLDPALDNNTNTVMSYTGPTIGTLGPLDLDAVAAVYGAPGSGGTQIAFWWWDPVLFRLTQDGDGGAEVIQGVTVADIITGRGGADTVLGLEGADTLNGGAGNDLIFGGGGVDDINGGPGADTMLGGRQNDRYVVDDADDWVIEAAGQGTDHVISSASFFLWENVENLTLTGSADIDGFGNEAINRIAGNAGANLLYGFGGNDNLIGGAGDDTLNGGGGRDRLTGGIGADWFLFENAVDGPDKIVDFVSGEDLFFMASEGFGGLPSGTLDPANFVAHASYLATAASGMAQFVYHTGAGVLLFDADGAGGAAAQRVAALVGAPAVAASDFLLFAWA
jgi:Ca2+-binding RTX toxin-like protein